MLTRIYIPSSPLANVLSAPLHGTPDFVLISFTGTNPSIHLNLKDIFVWEIKLTRSVSRPVLDFELCIDLGDYPPVCCCQPKYRYYDRKIMNTHIQALGDSGLITDCTWPWGSLSLLAQKLHQEDCNDVKSSFVDCAVVNGHSMASLTALNFQFPGVPTVTKNLVIPVVFYL